MTAASLSSLPTRPPKDNADDDDDVRHHDPAQHLHAMSTSQSRSGPTPVQTPRTLPSPPTPSLTKDASNPGTAAFHTPRQGRQTEAPSRGLHTMAKSTPLARPVSTIPADITNFTNFTNITSSPSSTLPYRPLTPHAQTEPSPDTATMNYQPRPRNRSPYSRSHLRSLSASSTPSAPLMTRAHSLPTVMHPTGQLLLSPSPAPLARPTSPLRSPKRTKSPRGLESRPLAATTHERYGSGIRPASSGSFDGAPSVCDISEDAELELAPRTSAGLSSLYSSTGSLSRRRRPASPLYHASVPFGAPPTSTPTSASSSPLLGPSKFNEHYPSSLASSSVSSTPTSMRSRSPSISSLDTIEDSPDAEEEAIEEDRIARLKAAADREDGGDQRRSSLDVPEGRGRSLGFGKRDSRKRWSVCGAERRQDLDLETIWED